MAREFDDLKDGTVLEPYHLNMIYRELRRLRKMTAAPPLVLEGMTSTTSPPFLYPGGIRAWGLGKANGTIPARSGTTPGAGTVDVWWNNGGALAATGDSLAVLNVGTVISSGKYVWYEQDESGDLYVAPLECEP